MAKVQVTKSWTVSPNIRLTPFVSLLATAGWWAYENKVRLLAAGWTMKFSSNGSTGPASSNDTTDNITSAASFATRATASAASQSWFVVQNADGVQLLFTYQGAGTAPTGDDIIRISMSQNGLFTPQGYTFPTNTYQPTATDEVIIAQATSVINATASADRVMSIGCTNKDWWCATFRAGAITLYLACNEIDSACDTVVLAKPYVVSCVTNLTCDTGNPGFGAVTGSVLTAHVAAIPIGSTYRGCSTRVVTSGVPRIIRLGGGARTASLAPGFTYPGCVGPGFYSGYSSATGGTLATPPALNNGTIPVLTIDWFGENTAGMDGYLGSPIDWWYGHTSSVSLPATGDMIAALAPGDTQATPLRTNWLVAIGSGIIRPWLNAAANLEIT